MARVPPALLASFAVLAVSLPLGAMAQEEAERRSLSVIGQVEDVRFADGGLTLEARIDTGATSTSVDARDIETFERDGDEWVRFEVVTDDADSLVMERRVADTIDIVGAGGSREERYVVEIDLCLADVLRTVEVNLADREGLTYRLLIGRDLLLDGGFLVNVAQDHSHEPRCDGVATR